MEDEVLKLQYANGLWLGVVNSHYGFIEVLLGGNAAHPDEKDMAAFRRFAVRLDENIAKLWKKVRMAFLYHPIRLAINNENRVGVQFRNWITKDQSTMILEDL